MSVQYSTVLGLDIGAKRCGWAFVERNDDEYVLMTSGVTGLEKLPSEKFGVYRTRLTKFWVEEIERLCEMVVPEDDWQNHHLWLPSKIVMEIIPTIGGADASQRRLGQAVATTVEAIVHTQYGIPVEQIAATTVKKRLTGSGRATKVSVRNKVLEIFPELVPRKKELTKTSDESDAVAIALVGAGYES